MIHTITDSRYLKSLIHFRSTNNKIWVDRSAYHLQDEILLWVTTTIPDDYQRMFAFGCQSWEFSSHEIAMDFYLQCLRIFHKNGLLDLRKMRICG